MKSIYRIIDANLNRAAEGIRVVEDLMRFLYEDKTIASLLRNLRHKLRKTFAKDDIHFLNHRNIREDVGVGISNSNTHDNKTSVQQLLQANLKRIEEALRVMEETFKVAKQYSLAKQLEALRYNTYDIEKQIQIKLQKIIPIGLYGITAEKFANGRTNVECVKQMVQAGIKIIQYREKDKPIREKIVEAKQIATFCKKANVLFIMNDHPDIALLVNADGVHIGQNDMHIADVRKIVGEHKIIGVSTHAPAQAQQAVKDGADYIGVGPIFPTTTKDRKPVGLEYLEYVTTNIKLPYVAIGGIKENNIDQIVQRGAQRISLVSEIVGADDISKKVMSLNEKLKTK